MKELNNHHVEEICDKITLFLKDFDRLLFSKGFGFDPFKLSDVENYLKKPEIFNIAFNREKSNGILYGQGHVFFRRFINQLTVDERLSVLVPKLEYAKLVPYLERLANKLLFQRFSDPIIEEKWSIVDINDIGMGDSVYRVSLLNGTYRISLVVKHNGRPLQAIYCQLLTQLEWPSFETNYHETTVGNWEISEYLGEGPLSQQIINQEVEITGIIPSLARHAALGDLLGRGDRLLENYVLRDNHVFPCDISYLFCKDNEIWTEKYISGGMYEYCCIAWDYPSEDDLLKRIDQFWDNYQSALEWIKIKRSYLKEILSQVSGYSDKYLTYLENSNNYINDRRKSYMAGLRVMKTRQFFKELLHQVGTQSPESLNSHPELKMYYLADKGRAACFFLLEEKQEDLLEQLTDIAEKELELPDKIKSN